MNEQSFVSQILAVIQPIPCPQSLVMMRYR